MPTQTQPNELSAAVAATARTDKARVATLRQAKADAKALFDCLNAAAQRDQDADVRAGLITAAKARLALVAEALRGL